MSRVRLRASALRERVLPGAAEDEVSRVERLCDEFSALARPLTRREALQLAGVAGAAAAGLLGPRILQPLAPPAVGGSYRRAWLLSGRHSFIVDPARFGNSARLSVSRNGNWRATLTDAFFPGTSIPADLDLATSGAGMGTRLLIQLGLGRFSAEVPLAQWLSGEHPARSSVKLSGTRASLDDGSELKLSGTAVATLQPDWTLKLEGKRVATLKGENVDASTDVLTIALAPKDAPTVFSRQIASRTFLTLERGGNQWRLGIPAESDSGTLHLSPEAFDRITIEAAQTGAATVYQALIAHTAKGVSSRFSIASALDSDPADLPLQNVRYARVLGNGSAFHLAADFLDEPTWLRGPRFSMLVGAASWAPPFEIVGENGSVQVSGQPALFGISAPFGDSVVGPLAPPPQSQTTANVSIPANGTAIKKKKDRNFQEAIRPGDITFVLPDATALSVIRPADMLVLRFEFFNLRLDFSDDAGPRLKRNMGIAGSHIVVNFPPQHILEKAFREGIDAVGAVPIQNYLADESRLVFRVPDGVADAGIPYTLEGLLNWSGYVHKVAATAQRVVQPGDLKGLLSYPGSSALTWPRPPVTSIEIPWGMYLSPFAEAGWTHRSQPMTHNGRTELWHTRLKGWTAYLGGPIGASAQGVTPQAPISMYVPPSVRAIWAFYYNKRLAGAPPPSTFMRNDFTTSGENSPTPPGDTGGFKNRWAVVDLTARYHDNPIDVRNMMLTALGGWFSGRGFWDVETLKNEGKNIIVSLEEWDHRATMGRDHYVKLVLVGRLFPFGHTAVLVTISERKFKNAPGTGKRTAYIMQKQFIIVREPVKTYEFGSVKRTRQTPFRRVEIKTRQTPPINQIKVHSSVASDYAFWPKTIATGADFLFQIEATDWDGRVVKFGAPLIYMAREVSVKDPESPAESTVNDILTKCDTAYRTKSLNTNSQTVAFSESIPAGPGAPASSEARALPTKAIRFGVEIVSPSTLGDIRYYPAMHNADVQLEAVEELTNQNAPTTIQLATLYLNGGYTGANTTGKVFAEIVSAPSNTFPPSLAGGLATPMPEFTGLSATKGAFGGDVGAMAAGQFDPFSIFESILNAELLGGITLKDVFQGVAAMTLDKMPVFEKVLDPGDPNTVIVRFTWQVPLTSQSIPLLKPKLQTPAPPPGTPYDPTKQCVLQLTGEMRKSLTSGAPPTSLVTAELTSFDLVLVKPAFDGVILTFKTLKFESRDGGAPDVTPEIIDVKFGQELAYLAEIAKYLGALGGGGPSGSGLATQGVSTLETVIEAGPLKIDVTGQGITASLTIALPDIAIGVFSLKNMSIYAGLTLPFTGDPVTLDFWFCSRERPFELLVMGFGGGGYVLMTFDAKGIVMLEISLEFGAGTSFSLGGLASGSVEIKGGFIVRYDREPENKMSFTIFIRLAGCLEILGLISVSLTFYIALTYETFDKPGLPGQKGDKLTGTATLTIEIELVFFTIPVKLSVKKELAGEDPRFKHLMPVQADWNEYCQAFAPAQLGA